MSFGYVSPSSGPSGDNDEDDQAVKKYTTDGVQNVWTPPGWHASPRQLEEHARAMNVADHAALAGPATKHSNPPQVASQRSF